MFSPRKSRLSKMFVGHFQNGEIFLAPQIEIKNRKTPGSGLLDTYLLPPTAAVETRGKGARGSSPQRDFVRTPPSARPGGRSASLQERRGLGAQIAYQHGNCTFNDVSPVDKIPRTAGILPRHCDCSPARPRD